MIQPAGASWIVRPARPEDTAQIREVERAAFPTEAEADLVEALVASGDVTFSLIAEADGAVLGHLLCSRMQVDADDRAFRAVALGPVAVLAESQSLGIGAALIREALERSRKAGEEVMFVLGDPAYYGRFGFSAETARPFASPYAGEYFMAIRFGEGPPPRAGRADYAPAFAALEQTE